MRTWWYWAQPDFCEQDVRSERAGHGAARATRRPGHRRLRAAVLRPGDFHTAQVEAGRALQLQVPLVLLRQMPAVPAAGGAAARAGDRCPAGAQRPRDGKADSKAQCPPASHHGPKDTGGYFLFWFSFGSLVLFIYCPGPGGRSPRALTVGPP